jgi:hypothetical protein
MPNNPVNLSSEAMNRLLAPITCLILALIATHSFAAPDARLWPRWAEHNDQSTKSIQHDSWHRLLNRYVVKSGDGINRFAYQAVSGEDRIQLSKYLATLAETPISQYNRRQQRAFWINLYNALTIQAILDNYPVESIRDIKSGFFSSGPWSLELISIEGEALTLDDIEHRILRPIWQDSRIHYAVNCASLGCPNLQQQAFTADNTEALLNQAASEFINHPRAVAIDNNELVVSSIYDWFEDDFGDERGVIMHIKQFADDQLTLKLGDFNEIDDYHYDWRLNDAVQHAKGLQSDQ